MNPWVILCTGTESEDDEFIWICDIWNCDLNCDLFTSTNNYWSCPFCMTDPNNWPLSTVHNSYNPKRRQVLLPLCPLWHCWSGWHTQVPQGHVKEGYQVKSLTSVQFAMLNRVTWFQFRYDCKVSEEDRCYNKSPAANDKGHVHVLGHEIGSQRSGMSAEMVSSCVSIKESDSSFGPFQDICLPLSWQEFLKWPFSPKLMRPVLKSRWIWRSWKKRHD